jgi:hypothetical protein
MLLNELEYESFEHSDSSVTLLVPVVAKEIRKLCILRLRDDLFELFSEKDREHGFALSRTAG